MVKGYVDTDSIARVQAIQGVEVIKKNKRKLSSLYGEMSRPVVTARFVNVLQIDTEHQSYLIREGQHLSVILSSGTKVFGVVKAKDLNRNSIIIRAHGNIDSIHEVFLSDIAYLQ